MKKENIIYTVMLVMVSLLLVYSVASVLYDPNTNTKKVLTGSVKQELEKQDLEGGYEARTSNGKISIELTPKGFNEGKFYIDMSVNTHSGNLADYDLKQLTTMEFEGKTLLPSEAPQLSGHHSGGILVFDTGKEPTNFKVIIKSVPDVELRTFEW